MKTLAGIIDKGVEVYSSLNVPEEIKEHKRV